MPGLKTLGVPRGLKGNTFPFKYNSKEELSLLLKKNKKIKIIVIEGARKEKISKEMVDFLPIIMCPMIQVQYRRQMVIS